MITDARHPGSVPPEILRSLRRAENSGKLLVHVGETEVTGEQGSATFRVAEEHFEVDGVDDEEIRTRIEAVLADR